jgi:DNA-binding MarR family transcriptional regulator
MKNISLKNKRIGYRNICDAETGEIIKISQYRLTKSNANFAQIFLPERGVHLMKPLHFTAAEHRLIDYFYINMDQQNKLYSPVAEITERLVFSVPTAYRSLTELRKYDFIRKKGNSFYMVNPDKFCKCAGDTRDVLLQEYSEYEEFKETE